MNEYQNVPDNTRNYPNGRGKKLLVFKGDEEDERGKKQDRSVLHLHLMGSFLQTITG